MKKFVLIFQCKNPNDTEKRYEESTICLCNMF